MTCGLNHTIVLSVLGDLFSWGANDHGQCGTSPKLSVCYKPTTVCFDAYHKPTIKQVSAGGFHSGFVDDVGRLFTCGRNDQG